VKSLLLIPPGRYDEFTDSEENGLYGLEPLILEEPGDGDGKNDADGGVEGHDDEERPAMLVNAQSASI